MSTLTPIQIESFAKVISHSQVFHGIDLPSLHQLVSLGSIVEVSANDFLVEEGQRVPGLYVLLEGSANVLKGTQPISIFGRGSFFGEISLFGVSLGATASVKAKDKAKFLLITKEVLHQWAKQFPSDEVKFLKMMCTELCRRLYSTSEKLS